MEIEIDMIFQIGLTVLGICLTLAASYEIYSRKLTSYLLYLWVLGASSVLALISMLINYLMHKMHFYSCLIDTICQFTTYTCSMLNPWLIVIYTYDRSKSLRWAIYASHVRSIRGGIRIIVFLVGGSLAFSSHVFYYNEMNKNNKQLVNLTSNSCDIEKGMDNVPSWCNAVDTLLVYIIPTGLIIVFNIATAISVCTTGEASALSTRPGANRQRYIACKLTTTSVIFLILNLPDYAIRFYVFIVGNENTPNFINEYEPWFRQMYKFHFAVDVFLYTYSGTALGMWKFSRKSRHPTNDNNSPRRRCMRTIQNRTNVN